SVRATALVVRWTGALVPPRPAPPRPLPKRPPIEELDLALIDGIPVAPMPMPPPPAPEALDGMRLLEPPMPELPLDEPLVIPPPPPMPIPMPPPPLDEPPVATARTSGWTGRVAMAPGLPGSHFSSTSIQEMTGLLTPMNRRLAVR